MSVVTTYAIFCDKCGNWEGDCNSRKQARHRTKRLGWKRVRDDGCLQDLCPQCIDTTNTPQRGREENQ